MRMRQNWEDELDKDGDDKMDKKDYNDEDDDGEWWWLNVMMLNPSQSNHDQSEVYPLKDWHDSTGKI